MPPKSRKKKNNDVDADDDIDLIEEISPEILKKLSGKELSKDATKLDLCDTKRFQLRSLDGMRELKHLDKLSDINLSKNKLKKIDILTMFRSLTKINASENEILSVSLSLEKLVELDLSNNKLQNVILKQYCSVFLRKQ